MPLNSTIRSFVRRTGRITDAQRRALAQLWPLYGLDTDGWLDLDALFGRRARRCVEIGFGNGEALLMLAEAHPEWDFLGIDVYPPGIGRLLSSLESKGLANVRVIRNDAALAFRDNLPSASLDRVNLWFPDPWPKKRHHKRRLVQPQFVSQVADKLRTGGRFHLATDWEDYAQQMMAVLEGEVMLKNEAGSGNFHTGDKERPVTKFQRRGLRLGHGVWDLIYQRIEQANEAP